jgi:SAM-dependent MidA family methyltransferase
MNMTVNPLLTLIRQAIASACGWLGFDRFMAMALYEPGLGYYSNQRQKFGWMPQSGSDFVTAPELSRHFGQALAAQVGQALQATSTTEVWEFGAGTGALAEQLLEALGAQISSYRIIDLSGSLRQRQAERLARWGAKVDWLDRLPEHFDGVVVGNEVLDAMPVQLLVFDGQRWLERGVVCSGEGLAFADREQPQALLNPGLNPPLRPPLDVDDAAHFPPGTVTEIHAQGEAFVRTLATQLRRGAIFLLDYGFPEAEYYHPQRVGGTVMCHHEHLVDADPLQLVGEKDITAHVNFSAIALAGQDAGLSVLGYTSQAHFLINCGLLEQLDGASLAARSMAHKLIAEHEMGELFKVIGFAAGAPFEAVGFTAGDRSHTL